MTTTSYTRRQLLELLLLVPAASAVCCRRGDWFGRERVCVHVYRPQLFLPPPLQDASANNPPAREVGLFTVGLPELLVCSTAGSLVDMFPYLWPLTREEFQAFSNSIKIEWTTDALKDEADIRRMREHLESATGRTPPGRTATVVLTMNEYTQFWASGVATAAREGSASELVIFKDPSVPPYLCDHPALQKRFKKPPP